MSLDVYLRGKLIGGLLPADEGEYSFAYTPETAAEAIAGEVLLSLSLPVRSEPFSVAASRAYVEGLLPQGPGARRSPPSWASIPATATA